MATVTHYLAIICAILGSKKETQEKTSGEALAHKIILLNNPQELSSKTKNLPAATILVDPEGALKTNKKLLCWVIAFKANTENVSFMRRTKDGISFMYGVRLSKEDPFTAIIIPFVKEDGATELPGTNRLLKVDTTLTKGRTLVNLRFDELVLVN